MKKYKKLKKFRKKYRAYNNNNYHMNYKADRKMKNN